MTQKLAAHYDRLRKPLREQGLWNWRSLGLAYHAAGEPLQSGTACVECHWYVLQQLLSQCARWIGLAWFLLPGLMCLRFNYVHFNHQVLPTWTDHDSLFATRCDSLLALARGMSQANEDQMPTWLEVLSQAYAKS